MSTQDGHRAARPIGRPSRGRVADNRTAVSAYVSSNTREMLDAVAEGLRGQSARYPYQSRMKVDVVPQ